MQQILRRRLFNFFPSSLVALPRPENPVYPMTNRWRESRDIVMFSMSSFSSTINITSLWPVPVCLYVCHFLSLSLSIYIYIYVYFFKWIVPQRDFFKLFTLLLHVFHVSFYYLQWVVMITGGVTFALYCDDCSDRVVVVFIIPW